MIRGPADFRQRLASREPMVGSFIKTPSIHATEILAGVGYDFVIVDEEHAPFDRGTIDLLMLATRAVGIDGLVRVASTATILSALDLGASGVLVPHVDTVAAAEAAVAAARHHGGRRGFSPSPRAGDYGARGVADHVARSDATASVSVMIEHPDSVRNVAGIAATDGVDALFLGLGDLAVAMGETSTDGPVIRHLAETVCAAALQAGKPTMATAPTVEAASWLLELGVTALVISSDQGLLRSAADMQLKAFRTRSAGKRRLPT